MAAKEVLLILDDVWRRSDVDAFDALGPGCRALVTTRDSGLLTSLGGVHHVVELLTVDEARTILADAAGLKRDALPYEADAIIGKCGRLPLAVSLCGSLVRRGLPWVQVLNQLSDARVDRIADRHGVEPRHRSVWRAIHIGVECLSEAERARFLELAAFVDEEATPESPILALWGHAGGLDAWEARELLVTLAERSLIQTARLETGWLVAIHDLIRDYLKLATKDETAPHRLLLAAYGAKCRDGWPSGPNDGYYYERLIPHMVKAQEWAAISGLLGGVAWVAAKFAAARDRNQVLQDYAAALNNPDGRVEHHVRERLVAYRRFVATQGHRLERYPDSTHALAMECPAGSVVREDALALTTAGGGKATFIFNRINVPSTEANPSLYRMLRFDDEVASVAVSNGGKHCLLAGKSGRVEYRDLADGRLVREFHHPATVAQQIWMNDRGTRAVSLDGDGVARLWDLPGGQVRALGAPFAVSHVSVAADFSHAILAGRGTELVLWDLSKFEARPIAITILAPEAISLSREAKSVLVADGDYSLALWDLTSFRRLRETSWEYYGIRNCRASAEARALSESSTTEKSAAGLT